MFFFIPPAFQTQKINPAWVVEAPFIEMRNIKGGLGKTKTKKQYIKNGFNISVGHISGVYCFN